MPGIEFVGGDTGDDVEDDVLEAGPRRPLPRWVWVVAALLVVAVAVGAVVSSHTDRTPHARPVPPSVSAPAPAPASADDGSGAGAQISALTSDGTSLFWVAGHELFRAGPVGRATISASIAPAGGDFAELQLVPDPAERTIWVVAQGENDRVPGSGSVEGFSTSDLSVAGRVSAPSRITGAAAFNGALYVLSAGRLLRTTAHDARAQLTLIARVDDGRAHGLVATDGGLAFVEGAAGDEVGRWSPGAGIHRPVALGTSDSTLATAGSTTFVAGTRAGHDELNTLQPPALGGGVDERNVATGLTGALELVATGRSSVLVLGGSGRGLQLSCVQADAPPANRATVQALATAVSANVAVLQGEVFQAVGSTVRPVSFGDNVCPA